MSVLSERATRQLGMRTVSTRAVRDPTNPARLFAFKEWQGTISFGKLFFPDAEVLKCV